MKKMEFDMRKNVTQNVETNDDIDVGFSREDERSARASRRKNKNRDRSDIWDDEDDGWN